MTPLPTLLAVGAPVVGAWRMDQARHAPTWDSGIGAERTGGRWNPKGVKAVYCALDPATTILELAVHMGFNALDTMPFILTCMQVTDVINVHIVQPADVTNANWAAQWAAERWTANLGCSAAGSTRLRSLPERCLEIELEHRLQARPRKGQVQLGIAGSLQPRYASEPAAALTPFEEARMRFEYTAADGEDACRPETVGCDRRL